MSIQFIPFIIWVFLEKFQDLNNFFWEFCQDWRRKDRNGCWFIYFLTFLRSDVPVYLQVKLGLDFASKRKVVFVSDKIVPIEFIEGRNKLPSYFTNTFQVLNIISFVTLNQFIKDVFLNVAE